MAARSSEPTLIDSQPAPKPVALFSRWVNKRLRIDGDAVTLNRHRLFILPTRTGIIYAFMLGAMLLFALNYNNSMIFVTTFLLSAVAVNEMWLTHRNLSGLRVTLIPPSIALAGGNMEFVLHVEAGKIGLRPAIEFKLPGADSKVYKKTVTGLSKVQMKLPVMRRGRMPIPQIRVATTYPLGLFQAWSHLFFPRMVLVAPTPVPRDQFPLPFSGEGMNSNRFIRLSEEDEFSGLRPYQEGDPLRSIAWRASARSEALVSKQYLSGAHDRILWLRWHDIPAHDTEARLSILCRWVLEAHQLQLQYGLSIPGHELPPRKDSQHYLQCLEALALFPDKR